MKLLAFGDLHLGAGTSLGRTPGDRLVDQADVLGRISAVAARENVDAILIAGDVFEGPLVTPEQMDVFAEFVAFCHADGIPVVAVSGNGVHDAAMRTVNGLAIFNRLPGITVYSRPELHDLGAVQVACLPWVSPARLVAADGGDVGRDRVNDRAAELLVKAAASIADPAVKPTVLMLHGSLSGASLPAGLPTDELREPVIPVEELLEQGWAAVVASHIHVPQITFADDLFWRTSDEFTWRDNGFTSALYTGSPMPLNFGETNVPHGVWILDIGGMPPGSAREFVGHGGPPPYRTRAEFVPIDSRPLVQVDVDVTVEPNKDLSWLEDEWAGLDGAIVKVTLRCADSQRRRLDVAAIRAAALAGGAHTVKIDVDTVREERSRVDGVTDELAPIEAFDLWAASNEARNVDLLAAREQMVADLETVNA